MLSSREAELIRTSSIESILSRLDGMSEGQLQEFIKGRVEAIGGPMAALRMLKDVATSIVRSRKNAQISWRQNREMELAKNDPRPSQLKQRLNKAGDYSYALALFLLLGTAGASDLGGDWKEILAGFLLTAGSAFMGWAFKKLSSKVI